MIDKNIIASNDEERLLISRAADLSAQSENRAVAASFLTPREQRITALGAHRSGSADRLYFWGGCPGCERRRAVFLPSWLEADSLPEELFGEEREKALVKLLDGFGMSDILTDFVVPVVLSGSGYRTLTHRDWLGALMSLGIRRESVGDIAVQSDKKAIAFVDKIAADFISQELKKAGSDTVSARAAELPEGFCIEHRFERESVTVASPRIDGAVKALCKLSREDAAELVSKGMVEVNYFTEENTDRHIAAGDVVSVRGHGKFLIVSAEDPTRRGRIRLVADKYV